jgi:gluconolactonase
VATMTKKLVLASIVSFIFGTAGITAHSQIMQDPPFGRPDAVVDLATDEGIGLVSGAWRYHDVSIATSDFRSVGPDLKPSGAPSKAYDYEPHAGGRNFDDSQWEQIKATSLDQRRSTGKVCFNWYRINITIPEKLGNFFTAGSTVAFEVVVDDYAEVWVDGRMPRVLGQPGGQVVRGFNAPNRVILTRDVRPGQRIQLAVFGMNGPVSYSPENFIWIKSATLDFYRSPQVALSVKDTQLTVKDQAFDRIVPAGAKIEKLAGGFQFTEGPVWVPKTAENDGYLLFSDPNSNLIYRWTQDGQLSIFMTKSGYRGIDIGEYGQPGSNGLTLDGQGRLTINQHGNRRVVRLEKNGQLTVLADHYEGKRLNSPNDLVYKSDGALYFTDPPFGLPRFFDDARKELPYSGVFRVATDGKVQLLSTDLKGPNGIAFSPDEKYLYVDNWDAEEKVVMRYEVRPDGTLDSGEVFFDMTSASGEDALDGMKVDVEGNLYVSGPGGIWILSPEGKHLGTISGPEHPHNFAWGDDDGKTLYLCAQTGLYRIRLNIAGIRPH